MPVEDQKSKTRKVRKLTFAAMSIFEDKVAAYQKRLSVKETNITSALNVDLSKEKQVKELNRREEEIIAEFTSFEATATVYINFLEATKTTESMKMKDDFMTHLESLQSDVKKYKEKIEDQRQAILEDIVIKSRASSISATTKAKIAQMEKSVALAEKEATLVKEKARHELKEREIEADLTVLAKKKEMHDLKAYYDYGEELDEDSDTGSVHDTPILKDLPVMSRTEKVKTFITSASHDQNVTSNIQKDLTNYILKKELLLSRIVTFNDSPETYLGWKTTFQQVITDLTVSPAEEIDLLIKWLGPESKKHAISLKSVNVKHLDVALLKIWERLDERYGSPEAIYQIAMKKLEKVTKLSNSDTVQWYTLSDILSEILALKSEPEYSTSLGCFDSSVGVMPIVAKLPTNIQEKWLTKVYNYKEQNKVLYPTFEELVKFVEKQAKMRNDPSLHVAPQHQKFPNQRQQVYKPLSVNIKKTDVSSEGKPSVRFCAYHNSSHSLNKCRAFRMKSLRERKQFLRDKEICYRCCEFTNHKASECKVKIKCCVCGNPNHPGALHIEPSQNQNYSQGGENNQPITGAASTGNSYGDVRNSCTQICGSSNMSKSCAKLVLVNVVNSNFPDKIVTCYAMLDDQSNKSLAKPELLNMLQIDSEDFQYTINSCAGTHVAHGRRGSDCFVSSIDGSVSYSLPTLIECPDIPNNRNEICSPYDASCHPHLSQIAGLIPEVNEEASVLLLIGRDLVDIHQVREQVTGPPGTPFAQKTGLGWVVIGDMCLGNAHRQNVVNVNKINVLNNGRPSLFEPCTSHIHIADKVNVIYDPVFAKHIDDDKPSLSVEDREFLDVMNHNFKKTPQGKWTAPLPFKSPRQHMPNNRPEALRRARSLHASLQRNPEKKRHMVEFMSKILVNGHAELAPVLCSDEECWYLPIFGVYNPKKPGQVRGVFDSSSIFKGVSLNSVLLTGPDLTNSLLGVLMRFRRETIAISADIEQMFYCFEVDVEHRNFLRFFWYEGNDTEKPLIEYRMTRHVFGNSPSPAIATYGLRRSVDECDEDVQSFVNDNFYVDDGLTSLPEAQEAVDLLKRTQVALGQHSLRLHKIASNDIGVMKSFPVDDLAKDLKSLDFSDRLPTQSSLGLGWDLNTDSFVFNVSLTTQAPSRRRILSVVNSVFDPLGFLAPFTLVGKLILRDITSENLNWDDPISPSIEVKWRKWESSLHELSKLKINRSYFSTSLIKATSVELHVFCDASEVAISAVVYLVNRSSDDNIHVGFVIGKSKVAPKKGHTIPRLELCGAVLAVEIVQTALDQLKVSVDEVKFYTDSKIVLGYINNQTRRFYTYVANRVEKIRRLSVPRQWNYIPSRINPADVGSRGVTPFELQGSTWLSGPNFLFNMSVIIPEFFPIIEPGSDKEVRPQVYVSVTGVYEPERLGCQRFEKFSSWPKLVTAISNLRHLVLSRGDHASCNDFHTCPLARSPDFRDRSESLILRVLQCEFYPEEVSCLKGQQDIPKHSSILTLDPYLDEHGVMRVGGRLSRSNLDHRKKHPVIVPGKHHIAKILVRHFHDLVQHQGRHLTEGAIRDSGYWITGGKRLISSQIFNCITCKRLRGKFQVQKMSDLPVDRVTQAAPFTYVGVDVFGPWSVVSRRTRGGQALSKRWAVLFTCLTIRAIHIEVIDEMSSSAFINALRRFISIRGSVKQFRSDRGSNFVGATDHLQVHVINVEDERSRSFMQSQKCQWVFNAPHSSHMGGSWERMIGITRRILESMLRSVSNLTHDVLVAFMAEVTAIVNSRPIVPVSSDPDNPEILSPSLLLTSKAPCEFDNHGNLDVKDLYRAQWRRVQHLADQFWLKWKREYLCTLQKRRKWNYEQVPLEVDDIVLLKDREIHRNCWPLGMISKIFPSEDNKIRKVEVKIVKDGKITFYTRPIVELVLLMKK